VPLQNTYAVVIMAPTPDTLTAALAGAVLVACPFAQM
jgi:hypothetical protein